MSNFDIATYRELEAQNTQLRDQLIRAFESARERTETLLTAALIAEDGESGSRHAQLIKKQIDEQLDFLRTLSGDNVAKLLTNEHFLGKYDYGLQMADKGISLGAIDFTNFSNIDMYSIRAAILNANLVLESYVDSTASTIVRVLEENKQQVAMQKLITGQSPTVANAELTSILQERGLTHFTKSNGQVLTIDKWVKTALHTQTMQAYNNGVNMFAIDNDINFCYILQHDNKCKQCSKLTSKGGKFILYANVRGATLNGKKVKYIGDMGSLPNHPGCRCTWGYYVEGYDELDDFEIAEHTEEE